MAPRPKAPTTPAKPLETSDSLLELGRGLLLEQLAADDDVPPAAAESPPGGGVAGGAAGAEVELALADLIRDGNGEIVLYNDSGFRTLALTTEATVVASGASGQHVTEAGLNVAGFRFVTFDDGTTLYYQEGLDLVTLPAEHA